MAPPKNTDLATLRELLDDRDRDTVDLGDNS